MKNKCCGLETVVLPIGAYEKLEEWGYMKDNHITEKYEKEAAKANSIAIKAHYIRTELL